MINVFVQPLAVLLKCFLHMLHNENVNIQHSNSKWNFSHSLLAVTCDISDWVRWNKSQKKY